MEDLQISTEKLREDMAVVTLTGRLDVATALEAEKALKNLLDYKVYKIIVDLTAVEYMSSAGAGVFIGKVGVAQENNGTIVLVNPQAEVKEVLTLLNVSKICPIVKDKKSAGNQGKSKKDHFSYL